MFALLILPSAALAWRPAPGYVFHFKDDSKDSPTKELINYYKEPALPVSLLTAWLSLSGSHLKGNFLKTTNFTLDFHYQDPTWAAASCKPPNNWLWLRLWSRLRLWSMDPGLTFTSVSLQRHWFKIWFAGMQRDGDLVRLWLLHRVERWPMLVRQLLPSAGL